MWVPSQKKRAKSEQVQLTLIQEKVVAYIEEVKMTRYAQRSYEVCIMSKE